MKQEKLNVVLKAHKVWLETDGQQGRRAELGWADLRGVDLGGAELRGAYLEGAELGGDRDRHDEFQS